MHLADELTGWFEMDVAASFFTVVLPGDTQWEKTLGIESLSSEQLRGNDIPGPLFP